MGSYFDQTQVAGAPAGARRSRVRFEGDAPEGLLDLLGSQPEYAGAATLTGVGSQVTELGESAMVVADYAGGFRTDGDFGAAQSAVWNLVAAYETWVVGLEQRHRQQTTVLDDDAGYRLDGDVAVLRLGRPVEDVGAFARSLTTAKEPFRVWGVPQRVDEDQWEVDAVDLHVGQPLRLEVLPDEVRVLLGADTCGNTLARLLTNLQQHLDARTALHAPACV